MRNVSVNVPRACRRERTIRSSEVPGATACGRDVSTLNSRVDVEALTRRFPSPEVLTCTVRSVWTPTARLGKSIALGLWNTAGWQGGTATASLRQRLSDEPH